MRRIAIVTGGSGGIGQATARLLAENGYMVYELSRSGANTGDVKHVSADVTKPEQVRLAVDHILQNEGRIDLLVNNAGFGISGAVECTDPADAHAQLEVNLFGMVNCVQAVLPIMRKQGGGRIVNVSSVASPIAIPFQAFYSASKAAIDSVTLALRNEVKPFGIAVCAVLPGDVKTGFTGARKKSAAGADIYGLTLQRAVEAMERDEQSGMPPELVAKAILRAATERNPRAKRVVGAKYTVFAFIAKLLPCTWTNALVGLIYK